MRIACAGGGPAGLTFALLAKKRFPDWHVALYERDRAAETFGWGVVLSDAALESLHAADAPLHDAIAASLVHWDEIAIEIGGERIVARGHGFNGIARRKLLAALQERAAELGVAARFETEVEDLAAFANADLIVACDGANSRIRAQRAQIFEPRLERGACRYVWLGTTLPLDAFTFLFERTEHGWFTAHAYRFDEHASTFIVECREETWRAHGLDRADTAATIAFCERLFARHLRGHRLLADGDRSGGRDWPAFVRVSNERWIDGNVALMGDAAHAAHFSVGSGTKLAMEDAIELAAALAERSGVSEALRAYEERRKSEVLKLQNAARNSAEWFENVARYAALPIEQFAYGLLTRSQRIGHENLRQRDPAYVERVERWFESASRAPDVAARGERPNETAEPRGVRESAPVPPMFVPLRLRDLVLCNRVVVSPMDMYSVADGVPGDFHLVHLGARALGGAGLVYTEMVCVSAEGRITPGCTGLYTDEQAAAWRRIVAFVHANSEANICLQLGHSGPKGSTKLMWEGADEPLDEGNWPVVGPSALPYGPRSQTPRELTRAQMDEIREQFVAAARRGDEAGFDMLELHCAHGYLLSSFITPLRNHRTDEYGGSLENRLRYPLEVFRALRAVWPPERPMSVRISATDWTEGGVTGDDSVAIARAFKAAGADLVDVSTGQTTPDARPVYGRLFQTPYADRIRNEVGIATMAVGNITDADQVNAILAAGRADLVALARPHLTDPAWTLHAAAALRYRDQWWPVQYARGKEQLERAIARGRENDRGAI